MKKALLIPAATLLLSGSAMGMEPRMAPVKSKEVAVKLSLAATLIPAAAGLALAVAAPSDEAQVAGVGLMSLGLALGPSVGRMYADGHFSGSLAARRLLGVGMIVAGMAVASGSSNPLIDGQTQGWKNGGAIAVAGAGLALLSVNAIRDIAAASRAASPVSHPKSGLDWNVGAKYFSKDKAVGASVTFKF